jgi:proteasome lid subunit RPN8/RPN11
VFPRRETPILRLTPHAFLKLTFLAHEADTEIGGFGISSEQDPLLIEEFVTVKQVASAVTVQFDDTAVADYLEDQVAQGVRPERCMRIWIHTHPGESACPSSIDEETFGRVFGPCDWAVMFILARGGALYARLRFGVGPGGQIELPVRVEWDLLPGWLDATGEFVRPLRDRWRDELATNVSQDPRLWSVVEASTLDGVGSDLDGVDRGVLLAAHDGVDLDQMSEEEYDLAIDAWLEAEERRMRGQEVVDVD